MVLWGFKIHELFINISFFFNFYIRPTCDLRSKPKKNHPRLPHCGMWIFSSYSIEDLDIVCRTLKHWKSPVMGWHNWQQFSRHITDHMWAQGTRLPHRATIQQSSTVVVASPLTSKETCCNQPASQPCNQTSLQPNVTYCNCKIRTIGQHLILAGRAVLEKFPNFK